MKFVVNLEKDKMIPNNLCPLCRERVTDHDPEHGGTVTDGNETRWHYDCWMKYQEENEGRRLKRDTTLEKRKKVLGAVPHQNRKRGKAGNETSVGRTTKSKLPKNPRGGSKTGSPRRSRTTKVA